MPGPGSRKGTVATTCNYCGGRGQVVQTRGFFQVATTCPACGGEGVRITDPCPIAGEAVVRHRAKLQVDVPPGVESGMWLQLRNQGELGDIGVPRGNLRIQVVVKKHPFLERRRNDLYCQVPISFAQAALGPRSRSHSRRCGTDHRSPRHPEWRHAPREGRGMPDISGRGRGDELVEVVVETPRHLTARQEELLREFAEIEHEQVSPRARVLRKTARLLYRGNRDSRNGRTVSRGDGPATAGSADRSIGCQES